jgi:hypothetical protein
VEIAAAQGVDDETLKATIRSCEEETLQQKVEEGILTQEQADAILERLENGELGLGHRHGGMHRGAFGPEISPEALQEKVEEGILTQEQADAILERLENREPCLGAGPGQMRHWSQQTGDGANWGEFGLGTGPGGMHRWGPMMR